MMTSRNIYIVIGVIVVLCVLGYSRGWFGGTTTQPVAPVTAPAS